MKVLTVTLHPALDRLIQVDRLSPGEPVSAETLMAYAGGKGINAARVLRRLGIHVLVTGFQGGKTGEICIDRLQIEGIQTSFIRCEQPTRITTVVYESRSGNFYPIYEPRQLVSQDEIESLMAHLEALIQKFDLCLLCGAGSGPGAERIYAWMIERAAEKQVPCLLDSSGASLTNGVKVRPFLVKINQQELAEIKGKPLNQIGEQVDALKTMVDLGVKIAAVSSAEKGMLATDGSRVIQGELVFDHIKNTIGCGDAMLAGMAVAVLRKYPIEEVVRWGVSCGSVNTQNLGAGFIDPELVHTCLPQVDVQRVNT